MTDLPLAGPAIDYAARDYPGFRRLLLDLVERAGTRWTERSAADLGVMLVELLAYHLDRLAYAGDRVAGEAFLATASLRESIRRHAALGDHRLDRGSATVGHQHFNLPQETSISLPLGTLLGSELEPGEEPEARLLFETTAMVDLDARRNEFRLARSVVAGAHVLRLLDLDRREVDLHAQGVRRHVTLLLAGADGRGEVVRVAGVHRGAVSLFTPLRADYVAGDEDRRVRVFGNIAPIRRGRTTDWLWVARAGISLADVESGVVQLAGWFHLRLGKLRALAREVEGLRPRWAGDAYLEQLRAHALRRVELAVCRLRDRLPRDHEDPAFERREAELTDAELALRELLRALAHPLPDVLKASSSQLLPRQRVPLPGERPRVWDPDAREWVATRPLWLDDPMLFLDDRNTLDVAVLSGGRSEPWEEVDDFLQSGPDDRHYVLDLDRDGRGTLCFGDGRHGALPLPGAQILARWICGDVTGGNIGHRALSRVLDPRTHAAYAPADPGSPDPVLFQRRDPATGTLVDIDGLTFNPLATAGARPPEVLGDVPRLLRGTLQRLEVPVTPADFVALLERRRDVAEAVVVGEPRQRLDLAIRVTDGDAAEPVLEDIRVWLRTHHLAGTRVRVRPSRVLHVALAVLLDVDPTVRAEDTARRARDALQALFRERPRQLGRPVDRADLYRAVEAVPGVAASEVLTFDWATALAPVVRDVLTPPPDAVLRCRGDDDLTSNGVIDLWFACPFGLVAELRFVDPDHLPPRRVIEALVTRRLSGLASPLLARRGVELAPADLDVFLNDGPLHGAGFRIRCRRLAAGGRPLTALRLRDREVPQLRDLHLIPVQVQAL